jgi:hypothetical protein
MKYTIAKSALAVLLVSLGAGLATPAAADQTLTFEVLRQGSPIGTHRVTIREQGDMRRVDIAIDMAVRFAFVTVYRYTHRATETWDGHRLVALDASTDDNGTRTNVAAKALAGGLAISGSGGNYVAPADTIPSSYWNKAKLDRTALLDTQSGKMATTANSLIGPASIEADGRLLNVTKYRVTGDLQAELGYAEDGSWATLAFEARGASILYRRLGNEQVAQLR